MELEAAKMIGAGSTGLFGLVVALIILFAF